MSDRAAGFHVAVDIVIPRFSPSGSGWEVVLVKRLNPPYQGMWALPGGHLNVDDPSMAAAAQREVHEETGLDIPLHLLQQVYVFEDFEDPRGKYICPLYMLVEPLSPQASIEAGDDASHVRWQSIDNLQNLPELAFNHNKILPLALRQLFASYYHNALGMQAIDACWCEIETASGQHCTNTAYWRYNGIAMCPGHMRSAGMSREIL